VGSDKVDVRKDKPLGDAGFTRRIVVTVLILSFFFFVYYIRHVFIFITFSALLAYLVTKPVDYFQERLKMPRTAAVLVALFLLFVFIVGLGFIVIPPIVDEFNMLIMNLPDVLGKIESYIDLKLAVLGTGNTVQSWLDQTFITLKTNIPGITQSVFTKGFDVVSSLTSAIFGSIIVPVMSYYFLKDSTKFRKSFEIIIPARNRPMFSNAIERINNSLGAYIRGQITLCLIIGSLATIGLLIFGVKYAFVLGLFYGITGIVPMAGPIIGCIPAILIALATSPVLALKVLILFVIIRLSEDYFIVPRVMGSSMNMHPVTVIIAMMIGARVMGVAGMFLSIPVTAVAKIIVQLYLESRQSTNGAENTVSESP
jgi:predicted PurR-regulated permease PerM